MSEYAILVHTFEKYSFLWPGMQQSWAKHFQRKPTIGTDVPVSNDWPALVSGPGEWSDRLLNLLAQIETDTVFYIQEDMWPKDYVPLDRFYRLFKHHNLLRLQLSPVTRYYTLYGSELPLFFHEQPKSKYLVNHQPAFWDKNFLISCLEKSENPWQNEYQGTCRLWQNPDKIYRKLAIYPLDWFKHVYQNGKFLE